MLKMFLHQFDREYSNRLKNCSVLVAAVAVESISHIFSVNFVGGGGNNQSTEEIHRHMLTVNKNYRDNIPVFVVVSLVRVNEF